MTTPTRPPGTRPLRDEEKVPGRALPPGTLRYTAPGYWEETYEFDSSFAPTWESTYSADFFAVPDAPPQQVLGSTVRKTPKQSSPLAEQVGGDHYKTLAIQPVEYCQKNRLGYIESNVVKYVTRHRAKNGRQDIEKAIHNLNILLEMEYPIP